MHDDVPDLVTLRILRAIGTTGTVGRAAAEVGISQQAASSRIRAAEQQLGFVLVDRTRHGSTLSIDGELLVEWSRGLLSAADFLADSVRTLRRETLSVLTVAASQTISEHFVPEWIAEFRRRPGGDVPLRLVSGNSAFVIDEVRRGAAAVGLIETPEVPADLASARVLTDELVVVVAPTHPWARRSGPVTAAELAAEPLVTRESGSGTRRTLELALARAHPELTLAAPAAVLATTAAIRAAVASGIGPAVLSVASVQDHVERRILHPVSILDLPLSRPFTALWRRGTTLPAAAELFFSIARG